MGTFILPVDLEPFATIDGAKAAAMIEDAEATAALAAPCLLDAEFQADAARMAAVKAILRGAILRWNEAGTGAVVQQQTGPFGQTMDTRQPRRGMFWPAEVDQLRTMCATFSGSTSGAFAVDMAPAGSAVHLPWCSLMFGATYCSCGVDIAGVPIFGEP